MANVGKNIRALRKQCGMTQELLAERLFVSRQTVSNYETGKSEPDIEMLIRIAQEFGTDAGALIYGPPDLKARRRERRNAAILMAATLLAGVLLILLMREAEALREFSYIASQKLLISISALPAYFTLLGYALMRVVEAVFGARPMQKGRRALRWTTWGLIVLWYALLSPLMLWCLRESWALLLGQSIPNGSYPVPGYTFALLQYAKVWLFLLPGAALWASRKRKE